MRFEVFVDETPAGEVIAETGRAGRIAGSFAYHPTYVARKDAYEIDPTWPLQLGAWPLDPALGGALADASPDHWGRLLIRKRRQVLEPGRPIGQLDYLLYTSDFTRQGALRFKVSPNGPYEHPDTIVPTLVALPQLLDAAHQAALGDEDAVRLLINGGTGSMGGARPKAAVSDEGTLLIAKFPAQSDDWDVMGFERTALELAQTAGIRVAASRLIDLGHARALVLERFDRRGQTRIGYVSALTMLELSEDAGGDYLDIAEAISRRSSATRSDLAELWLRIAFSIGINNTDDHLRNHGFLREAAGWRLSPAFDINPSDTLGDRATSVAGATTPQLAIQRLVEHAPDFGLTTQRARELLSRTHDALKTWRSVAAHHGVPDADIEHLSPTLNQSIATLIS